MGGRRAADLTSLVGKARTLSAAKRNLTRAVSQKDPAAIADASARLMATSSVGLQAVRYGLKLSPYISEERALLSKMSAMERNEAIRKEWSSIKKRERIRTPPEVDSAVVSAAAAACKNRR